MKMKESRSPFHKLPSRKDFLVILTNVSFFLQDPSTVDLNRPQRATLQCFLVTAPISYIVVDVLTSQCSSPMSDLTAFHKLLLLLDAMKKAGGKRCKSTSFAPLRY